MSGMDFASDSNDSELEGVVSGLSESAVSNEGGVSMKRAQNDTMSLETRYLRQQPGSSVAMSKEWGS
jgi:hypothetical protein